MVARLDRHHDPDLLPPVEPRADGQHDPVLGRRLVGARRHDQAGAANAIRIELLDHDPVEQRAELIAHFVRLILGWRDAVDRRALLRQLQKKKKKKKSTQAQARPDSAVDQQAVKGAKQPHRAARDARELPQPMG